MLVWIYGGPGAVRPCMPSPQPGWPPRDVRRLRRHRPGRVWAGIDIHLRRGLQKESLGSAILFALDQFGAYKAHIDESDRTGPS